MFTQYLPIISEIFKKVPNYFPQTQVYALMSSSVAVGGIDIPPVS